MGEQLDSYCHMLSTQPARLAKTVVLASLLGYSDYAVNLLDFYCQEQWIDESTYRTWKSSYIVIRSERKPPELPLWQKLIRRALMSRRLPSGLRLPAEEPKLDLINTRFYDSDVSEDYR